MKLMRPIAMLIALAVTLGGTVVLAATQGSKDDPLITLSYLESVLKPQLEKEVETAVASGSDSLAGKLDAAIAGYESKVNAALASAGGGQAAFQARSLAKNESFAPGAGRELLLVSGSAVAVGELTDTTDGIAVKAGAPLDTDHLYITSGASAGCKAVTDAKVMSR